jgi:uncharacterized damage-inducible protein DinB
MMETKQCIETWKIHSNINLYLLDAIEEQYLMDISTSKGRNVGEQFAHIHNVRLMWLKAACPQLLKEQNRVEKGTITKQLLIEALINSTAAISSLLQNGFEEEKIKGFKPHPITFLAYIISHESHHRGQILISLKQSGHLISKKIRYGLWEWGSR